VKALGTALCVALLAINGTAAAQGEAIYRDGRTSDGRPLEARRAGGLMMHGAQAACVNCHRRSGFGGYEGRSYIPPITSQALFQPQAPGSGVAAGIGRPAYTQSTLMRALRSGVDPAGRRFEYLMPRYRLSAGEVKSLLGYLRGLSAASSAGVEADKLHFATIVAPGMEPQHSEAMLNTLETCFASQNAGRAPPKGRKRFASSMRFEGHRKWQLHVWELRGAPQTWQAQLAALEAAQPVFAAVGGLGRGTWEPVQAFCEQRGLPCLFPHVDTPPSGDPGYYSLYLSRGVQLEAAVVAQDIAQSHTPVERAVQVLRPDDDGAASAGRSLAEQLAKLGVPIDTVTPESFAPTPQQPVVLWLRERDLQRLPSSPRLYLSAVLAGKPPGPLQASVRIASPYARFPEDAVRADAKLACAALRAAMQDIGEHLHRDFLVERVEAQMERLRSPEPYARLSLGVGQRFASKSGFLLQ
jgi:hypothetical protein